MSEESSNNIKERETKVEREIKENLKPEKSYVLYFIAVSFFIIIVLIIAIFIFVIKLNKSNTEVIKQLKERTKCEIETQKTND